MIEEGGKPWMNLSDLRQFIRLCGIKSHISYAACDILYVRLTRLYDASSFTKQLIKLDFNQFSTQLLPQLGKILYPRLSYKEAGEKIFKEELYPNLITNLPYLYEYYPELSDNELKEENDEVIELASLHNNTSSKPQDIENIDRMISSHENAERLLSSNEIKKKISSMNNYHIYIKGNRTFTIKPNEHNFCSHFLDTFSAFTLRAFKGFLKCLGKCFGLCLLCLMPTSSDANDKNHITEIKAEEEIGIEERRMSPSWEEICHLIINSFHGLDEESKRNQEKTPDMQLNMSNLLEIVGHITEVYSFSAVGFSKQVGWVYGSDFTKTSTVVLADNDYWIETY